VARGWDVDDGRTEHNFSWGLGLWGCMKRALGIRTGETIPYDPSGFKRGREVVDYLYRQTQQAWKDIHNSSHAEAFLTNYSRAAIGIFDQESHKKGVLRKAKQVS